jgi:restriction endonuclease S subunit
MAWEVRKLGDVCEVIAGQSPEGKFYNSEGNGLPFYQGKKEFSDKYIGKPTTWTTKTTKEAQKDDILMSVRAPVGPVNFSTQTICIGRGLAAIRAGKSADKEYIYNFLVKHENEIVHSAGAVFDSINKTQIESIEIPPPDPAACRTKTDSRNARRSIFSHINSQRKCRKESQKLKRTFRIVLE